MISLSISLSIGATEMIGDVTDEDNEKILDLQFDRIATHLSLHGKECPITVNQWYAMSRTEKQAYLTEKSMDNVPLTPESARDADIINSFLHGQLTAREFRLSQKVNVMPPWLKDLFPITESMSLTERERQMTKADTMYRRRAGQDILTPLERVPFNKYLD